MPNKNHFNSSVVPRMSDVFPQAVMAGNLIFISGTPGISPSTGKLISKDFEEQTRQVFTNIRTMLEEMGSGMSQVVKTTVFMVSGNDFGIVNKVYHEFFPDQAPARSTPQVMPFPGGILISVECIALTGSAAMEQ